MFLDKRGDRKGRIGITRKRNHVVADSLKKTKKILPFGSISSVPGKNRNRFWLPNEALVLVWVNLLYVICMMNI